GTLSGTLDRGLSTGRRGALSGSLVVVSWGLESVRLVPEAKPPVDARLVVESSSFVLDAVAIASSGTHVLALRGDGSVVSWGYNDRGQLGNGTRAESREPVDVKALDGVVAVAAGERHSVALRSDGSVLAWGENDDGQLGDGTRKFRYKPVAVGGLDGGVRAIAAGNHNNFAVLADGSVVGWGLSVSSDHQGLDAIPDHAVPIAGLDEIVAVACGRSSAVALTRDGEVVLWGLVFAPDRSVFFQAPAAVAGIDGRVVAIAAGVSHFLALTVDRRVIAWGDSSRGALGVDGATLPDEAIVQAVDGGTVAISAAHRASVALMRDGAILRWGSITGSGLPVLKSPTRFELGAHAGDVIAVAVDAALTADGCVHWWHTAREDGIAGAGTADERTAAVGGSRLGGDPDLPAGTAWPHIDGRALAFVAQIDLAELPPLDSAPLLPSGGLLSLFVLPSDIGTTNTFALLYTPASAELAAAQPPPALADDDRFRVCPMKCVWSG
ncbi:MAG TPA: DUF1963 domain-containing protein, partial [Solirubrobacteraceae bacterium]|nr:DUF1963 domain-containing protein [Solirubrobacteraceae bacterium]